MNPRGGTRLLLVLLISLAAAGAAAAASRGPKSGTYKGRTGQNFPISFKIVNGRISQVDTTTRDTCPDGTSLRVHQNAFRSAKLDRRGRFTLRAGPAQQPAAMTGKVKGSRASGTITDRPNDPAGRCLASATWSAKLAR